MFRTGLHSSGAASIRLARLSLDRPRFQTKALRGRRAFLHRRAQWSKSGVSALAYRSFRNLAPPWVTQISCCQGSGADRSGHGTPQAHGLRFVATPATHRRVVGRGKERNPSLSACSVGTGPSDQAMSTRPWSSFSQQRGPCRRPKRALPVGRALRQHWRFTIRSFGLSHYREGCSLFRTRYLSLHQAASQSSLAGVPAAKLMPAGGHRLWERRRGTVRGQTAERHRNCPRGHQPHGVDIQRGKRRHQRYSRRETRVQRCPRRD